MKESFPIVPASNGPLWFFAGLSVFLLTLLFFFGWIVYSSRTIRFDVTQNGLDIRGGLYGRNTPLTALDLDRAKPVDLTQDRDYQLKLRTNGAGLPGYCAGWFRLRNGEKCLAFVTDNRHVLYVPGRSSYSLMLSVADPSAMLDALRRASGK